jgi:hypothetical protein
VSLASIGMSAAVLALRSGELCGGATLERSIAKNPPAGVDAVDTDVAVAVSGVRPDRSWKRRLCGILELRERRRVRAVVYE